MTNHERLQTMSAEEFADWLDTAYATCPWCDVNAPVIPGTNECELWDCKQCVLKWLEREVDV